MRTRFLPAAVLVVALGASTSACSTVPPPARAADAARVAVSAPDRAAEDRALDGGRHPEESFAFFGIAPGMRVAEIQAGGGYSTELLARIVGPTGTVYAQNNRFILEKYAERPLAARLAKTVNRNVVRVDRELDDPLPPDATELDVVLDILFYHDTVWMNADRAQMNANIFRALKHGGTYGIIDHSARAGAGLADVRTLHRIEESVVKKELEHAGFRFVREASFLRNADDTRDWSTSPSTAAERRGTSDRFVLAFVKP